MNRMATDSWDVLIVDDYEPWRRFVSSTLRRRPEFEVVGEVSDGLEAVEKAAELKPDLILLDVGLPKLNGIEAARRIRKLSPDSKILFVSQQSSFEVVEEALWVGARGYLVKADAGSELLTALNAVVRDERFIGNRFAGYHFPRTSADSGETGSVRHKDVPAAPQAQRMGLTRGHDVGFYSDEQAFLDGFTDFLAAALKAGKTAILIATESHRSCLLQRLQASGVDVAAALERKSYIALDIADSLPTFIADGSPDQARLQKTACHLLVNAATAQHHHVAVG
jgi:DNA-binding NarL/FixJ family response regulator